MMCLDTLISGQLGTLVSIQIGVRLFRCIKPTYPHVEFHFNMFIEKVFRHLIDNLLEFLRSRAGKVGFEKLHRRNGVDIDHGREQFIEYALPHLNDGLGIVFDSVQL